ncbi:hypothetical protein JHD48_08290 [Sulfurimonas sp. SAG-AH-194-I05]|nr:hypothetical protein [Sulfurimonas sp. SAG-AH-194-I05]MDF1875732.1 hypothetical protein [Sulfurimonas sp. SAG-AH-194-I05]
MSEKIKSIHAMQDVYAILNISEEDSYEIAMDMYNTLREGSSEEELKILKKAYKLIGVLYGTVENAQFNAWYNEVIHALSKLGKEFEIYEGEAERISIIDYMEPEIFLDGFLKDNTAEEFSKDFYNKKETQALLDEANFSKISIEASLERMKNLGN